MKKIKLFIYWLLERTICRSGIKREISGAVIRFPLRWARYFEKDYESDNIRFLSQQCTPGSIVIDIGAHLGLMSVIASKLAGDNGQVFAFEPTPGTFESLKRVLAINGCHNVTAVNLAVAQTSGNMNFYLSADEGSNSNSLVAQNHRNRMPVNIAVTTLDDFVREKVVRKINLLKIDAEGAELDVLKGATKILSTSQPVIILAIHPSLIKNNGQDAADIFDLLIQNRYRIFWKEKEISRETFISNRDFFDVHLLPSKA